MNATPPSPESTPKPAPRNIETQARHEHESFWQIFVPLIIGVTLLLAMLVLVTLSDSGYVSQWADVALIWLLPPQMFALLLCAVPLGGLAFGLWKLLQWLPGFTWKVQGIFVLIQAKVKQVCDALVEPILRSQAAAAGAKRLPTSLAEQVGRRKPESK